MKRRLHQQGIALITTLIMLSVVTLMAVAFLAVSRRERASVTTTTDRIDARAMSDAALQRAEAEILSRVLATSNLLSYDLLVSTNFLNPAGFVRDNTNIANVSFRYADGTPVEGNDLLQVYRNLQVDPRVPVYIVTNLVTGEEDFRYFLDLNRNTFFDTNGVQPEIDGFGRPLGVFGNHVGDPEWIGVLRYPNQPHSGSNHFVGRFAFLIQPAGKTLDLNYIHNQVKRLAPAFDGFHRNQGVGGWEINLAAFLRDLNTNVWSTYDYRTNLGNASSGLAFDDATDLLRQRYRLSFNDIAPTYANLRSVIDLFGTWGANVFRTDGIDGYGDGPLQLGIHRPFSGAAPPYIIQENDFPAQPWPGAPNPQQYFDSQEFFTVPATPYNDVLGYKPNSFTNRLYLASTTNSTYGRHTFYRLLGQLGTDSLPANRGKVHLNFDNRLDFDPRLAGVTPGPLAGFHTTNFVAWTPTAFFTNAADRILKAIHPQAGGDVPLVAVTNIQIWPTNYYSPAVHRALQVAANIYDATTNRLISRDAPYYPSVFRPVFGPDPSLAGALRIDGYEELTDDWETRLWGTRHFDVDEGEARPSILKYDRVAGIPVIVGAKKGFPNFNEIEVQTMVTVGRKLELVKRSPGSRPAFTNQLYTVGLSNVFGVEFWNSYRTPYPRPLELRARLEVSLVLSNESRVIRRFDGVFGYTNTFPAGQWLGDEFRIPINTNLLFLPTSAYRLANGLFYPIQTNRPLALFEPANGFPIPIWRLNMTNRLQAALIDQGIPGGRLVDYVDLDNLNTHLDITRELFGQEDLSGQTSVRGSFWKTNYVQGIPEGVRNQIQASLGSIEVANWNSVSAEPLQGQDKEKAITGFRNFVFGTGTTPDLRMQAPFSPGIKLLDQKNWQVNDPLVNDLFWDLFDPQSSTNSPLPLSPSLPVDSNRSNLGIKNYRYRPWTRGESSAPESVVLNYDLSIKDPQITRSDDWDFPTNSLPTLGWLGRIHRGTPWQTIYLKSTAVPDQLWQFWTGHPTWVWPGGRIPLGTHPTNDWRIVDVFTAALNDNAARGLLSVNQDGLAAWSAVLSGVPVLTNQVLSTNYGPWIIEPSTPELRRIVEGINYARIFRPGGKFNYHGEILSTPELTIESPYLSIAPSQNGTPLDAVVERIPQMILSLTRADDPRFVVYAFGQSLRPAPGSVVTDFGDFFQMPTNYTITGEFVTKTLMRLESVLEANPVTGQFEGRIRPVKETYNEVPPTE